MRHRRRASRFDLELDAWYRTAAESEWHHGVTRNVSETGALIAGDAPPAVDPVAVVISLPAAGCLVGRGRILSTAASFSGDAPLTFAIAVERYRIRPRDAALDAADDLLQGWYAR